jgi:hypothetical protein
MKEILLGRKSGCQQIGARKIHRFFSQPFQVAEQFTGGPGVYVTRDDDRVSCSVSLDPDRDHVGDDLGVRESDLEAVLAGGEGPPGGVGIVDELKGVAVDVPDDLLGRGVDEGAEGESGHRLGSLGIG